MIEMHAKQVSSTDYYMQHRCGDGHVGKVKYTKHNFHHQTCSPFFGLSLPPIKQSSPSSISCYDVHNPKCFAISFSFGLLPPCVRRLLSWRRCFASCVRTTSVYGHRLFYGIVIVFAIRLQTKHERFNRNYNT